MLPAYCLKPRRGDPSPPKFRVPNQANKFYENMSRAYRYKDNLQAHALVVPQPFVISPRWKNRFFQPIFASARENEPVTDIFRHLAKWDDHQKLVEAYLAGPEDWSEWDHPLFSELDCGQELHHMGPRACGVESLYRLGLIQHPAHPDAVLVFIAATKELEVPIIRTADKYALDEYL